MEPNASVWASLRCEVQNTSREIRKKCIVDELDVMHARVASLQEFQSWDLFGVARILFQISKNPEAFGWKENRLVV